MTPIWDWFRKNAEVLVDHEKVTKPRSYLLVLQEVAALCRGMNAYLMADYRFQVVLGGKRCGNEYEQARSDRSRRRKDLIGVCDRLVDLVGKLRADLVEGVSGKWNCR